MLFGEPTVQALQDRRRRLIRETARGGLVFVLLRAALYAVAMSAFNIGWDFFGDHRFDGSRAFATVVGSCFLGSCFAVISWCIADKFLSSDKGKVPLEPIAGSPK
jgi:hypothetical protein